MSLVSHRVLRREARGSHDLQRIAIVCISTGIQVVYATAQCREAC